MDCLRSTIYKIFRLLYVLFYLETRFLFEWFSTRVHRRRLRFLLTNNQLQLAPSIFDKLKEHA